VVAWQPGRVCDLGIVRYRELGVNVDCQIMGEPMGETADVTTTVITSESELDLAYAEIRRLKRIIQDYAAICKHSQAEIARLRSRLNDAPA
jgi:hypothetical protein